MSDENKVASIDVHKKVLMVVVGSTEGDAIASQGRTAAPPLRNHDRRAGPFVGLAARPRVNEVVMESTAQYWKPVRMELEPYMRLHLAQAFSPTELPRGGSATSATPSGCGGIS